MSIGKILLKILSPAGFKNARKWYHKVKNIWYPKQSEDDFRKIITQELGVKKGSVVFVHSSVSNLNLGFPFFRILPILLEIVGEEGTLVFPCWHFDYRAEDYLKKDELFDVLKSPTVMGVLPEFARRYKNAYRSLHPTSSVVAIGKYAQELTKDHINSEYPGDEHSPFYKIMNYNGIIIGIGVSTYNLSFVHCIEDVMKNKFPVKTVTDDVFNARVRDEKGEIRIVKTRVPHEQIKFRDIEEYMKKNVSETICRDIKIKGVKYFTANSCELYKRMEWLANNGITIYTKEATIRN
ncbi:MAG: AAC(3) family N-acetyltransferase [Bacteroidia bacterium]